MGETGKSGRGEGRWGFEMSSSWFEAQYLG